MTGPIALSSVDVLDMSDSIGLGYDDIAADNPALAFTSITRFRQTGPYSGWKSDEIDARLAMGKERTGYPTQKLQASARRIIEASSNPGDLALDCFAGCACVPVAAERTGRRWIACDISPPPPPRAWTVVRRQFHKQPDLRIVTEGEYAESEPDEGMQPDLGDNRVIRVRGPLDIPERTTLDEQNYVLIGLTVCLFRPLVCR